MKQKIQSFHQDDQKHWVANLICGHKQHVRHDPPMVERTWVLTDEGRNSRIGQDLECRRCDEVGIAIGHALQKEFIRILKETFEHGGEAGMCAEGREELAIDAIQSIHLLPIIKQAIYDANPPSQMITP